MRRQLSLIAILTIAVALPAMAVVKGTAITQEGAALGEASVAAYRLEPADAQESRWRSEKPERVPLASGFTDKGGNFLLDVKGEPVVTVEIRKPGFAPVAVRLADGEDAGAVAARPAVLRQGRVTAAGQPVANALVIFLGGGGAEVIARSGADGTYSVAEPAGWATRVVTVHPEFATRTDLVTGRKVETNLTLDRGVELKGRVVNADGKTPAAGATLFVDGVAAGRTGEDGSFTISRVPSKWRTLTALAGSMSGAADSRSSSPSIRLSRSSTVSGSVVEGRTSRGLAGSVVAIYEGGFGSLTPRYSTVTDSRGNFSVPAVTPGSYRISVDRPGYEGEDVSISVRAGESVSRTLATTATMTVAGVVRDTANKPVPGARVSTRFESSSMMPPRMRRFSDAAYTGPDGRFVARRLTAQSPQVILDAARKGFPTGSSDKIKVAAGETRSGVVITIPRGITVQGVVKNESGDAVPGVIVEAREAQPQDAGFRMVVALGASGPPEDSLTTKNDGTFSMELKEGSWDLTFRGEGYAPKSVRGHKVEAAGEPLEVVIREGAEITGRVVRADGTGVPDANLFVLAEGNIEPVVTGPDGRFVITGLTPGAKTVNISKRDEFIQEMRQLTAPAHEVEIKLPPGGVIRGRVVDKASKNPVTSFEAGTSGSRSGGGMMIRMPAATRPFNAEDGTFVLENVPVGVRELVVSAPGYARLTIPGVRVEEGAAGEEIEVALEASVRVHGKVTGPDGAPVSGVSIAAGDDGGGLPGGMRMRAMMPGGVTTDGNGEYEIDTLQAGDHELTFMKDGYLTQSKAVKLSGREQRVDIRLATGQRVGGSVVDDTGRPVSGAYVTAQSALAAAGGVPSRTTTRDDGSFEMEGLAPGRYSFSATKEGLSRGRLEDVDISAGGAVQIVMSSGGTIVGRILGIDPAENEIRVFASVGGSGAGGRVDQSGNYRIEGVPPGTARVMAQTVTSMGSGSTTTPKTVEVTAGSEVSVDLEFRTDVVVSGRVVRNGEPVSGARVLFRPENPATTTGGQTVTDQNGRYEMAGLESGTYLVSAMDPSTFSAFEEKYEVRGSGTFDIEFRGSVVRGRVVDGESGEPLAGVQVQVQVSAGSTPRFLPGTASDSRGEFTIENVPAGQYTVRAQKQNYGQQVLDANVSESASSDLSFKLYRTDGLTFRVVDGRDGRSLEATYFVRDARGAVAFQGSSATRSDGTARLSVAPGAYRAWVFAQGYAPMLVSANAPSEVPVRLTRGGNVNIEGGARQLARLLTAGGDDVMLGPYRMSGEIVIEGVTPFERLAPGNYTLVLLGENRQEVDRKQFTVVEGQTTRVTL